MARKTKAVILLTGFGPFPDRPENASSAFVPALAAAIMRARPEVRCAVEILPTEWAVAPARCEALRAAWSPVLALHFGVSPRAKGFVIETRARNERQPMNDAAGSMPAEACVATAGPDFLATMLPFKLLVERLRAAGIPAVRSHNAGKYLCNAVLYEGLWAARQTAATSPMTGFIHLPVDLPQAAARAKALTFDQAIAGGLLVVSTCLEAAAGAARHT
jgi:pyroglutamyl-peptidase